MTDNAPTRRDRLTKEERAELCSRVDFRALVEADGIAVAERGGALLCRIRDERTPSCRLYPPGKGTHGAAGWTWHDFGDDRGGDALAYLVDVRGMGYLDAALFLADRAGWTPGSLREAAARRGGTAVATPAPSAPTPAGPVIAPMAHDDQVQACGLFLRTLAHLDPESAAAGDAYVRDRGCLPDGWPAPVAYRLRADVCRKLAATLAGNAVASAAMVRAGLMRPPEEGKRQRLAWWDDAVLLSCMDDRARPVFLVGRRLRWTPEDQFGKYVNQACGAGAVRQPFNLPALYLVAGRAAWGRWKPVAGRERELVLVEGPMDALAAGTLGLAAVALLTKLRAHSFADREGAAARMLEPHLPAMRDLRLVHVTPDADPGDRGIENEALAARLVGWLRAAGVDARVSRLPELAPDAAGCKDLAEHAEKLAKRNDR